MYHESFERLTIIFLLFCSSSRIGTKIVDYHFTLWGDLVIPMDIAKILPINTPSYTKDFLMRNI